MPTGAIDIVCDLFTEHEVRGQTGVNEAFLNKVHFPAEYRRGVSIDAYLQKRNRTGIQRALLIAVGAGDMPRL